MTIDFSCENPECGKQYHVADSMAGKRVRCTRCQTVMIVPAGMGVPLAAQDDTPDPLRAASRRTGPPPTPDRRAGSLGRMAAGCLRAPIYGLSNRRSFLTLALYLAGISFVVQVVILYLSILTALLGSGGMMLLLLIVSAVAGLAIGGYVLRYYMDVVISSLEDTDQAPDVPSLPISELVLLGFKGMLVGLVYSLPVITILLLPLGLLALAYTNDLRAVNLGWALRAAVKRPVCTLLLYGFLLMWLAAGAAVIFAMVLAAGAMQAAVVHSNFIVRLVVAAVTSIFLSAAGIMVASVLYRCVGMLGRQVPEVLELLPERPNAGMTVLYLVIAAVCGGAWIVMLNWH